MVNGCQELLHTDSRRILAYAVARLTTNHHRSQTGPNTVQRFQLCRHTCQSRCLERAPFVEQKVLQQASAATNNGMSFLRA